MRELDELVHRFSRFIGQLPMSFARRDPGVCLLPGEGLSLVDWNPAVDITEEAELYTIHADMPEVRKEDIKVTVRNGILEITGERKSRTENKTATRHRVERIYGTFRRIFNLPEDVEEEKIKAECQDGVLTVTLPKSSHSTATQRTISIK